MQWLVGIGALLTLAGLAGIVTSIVKIARARRQETDDAVLRARLEKIVPLNLGSFAVSVLGLMCVMLGVMLS